MKKLLTITAIVVALATPATAAEKPTLLEAATFVLTGQRLGGYFLTRNAYGDLVLDGTRYQVRSDDRCGLYVIKSDRTQRFNFCKFPSNPSESWGESPQYFATARMVAGGAVFARFDLPPNTWCNQAGGPIGSNMSCRATSIQLHDASARNMNDRLAVLGYLHEMLAE